MDTYLARRRRHEDGRNTLEATRSLTRLKGFSKNGRGRNLLGGGKGPYHESDASDSTSVPARPTRRNFTSQNKHPKVGGGDGIQMKK